MRFSLRKAGRKNRRVALGLAIVSQFVGGVALDAASAHGKLKILHAFCAQANCTDGANPGPQATLLTDGLGNLYGTAASGGDAGAGTVFELQRRSAGGYKFKRLYSFCPDTVKCPDGVEPYSGLIMDKDGDLYGVTAGGGATSAAGVVYRLTPHSGNWQLSVLYTFCTQANCSDGSMPAGLTYAGAAAGEFYDGVSPLFGVARHGGATGRGSVFSLTPKDDSTWDYSTIYRFCPKGSHCPGGWSPALGMTMDGNGNLFGATTSGGQKSGGVLFELSQQGASWNETVIYDFCSKADCADGGFPGKPLLTDDGTFFGTTGSGGSAHYGVLYKFVPATGVYSVLYNFCSQTDCTDGRIPNDGLVMNSAGDLYGTTFDGGVHSNFDGTIFKFSNNAFSVVYNFCSQENCTDGESPYAGVAVDNNNNLIGVTEIGGAGANGVVFELKQ